MTPMDDTNSSERKAHQLHDHAVGDEMHWNWTPQRVYDCLGLEDP